MTDIPTTMRASVLRGKLDLAIDERPVPVPDADQVLVKVASVGVCGSDVHFYLDGELGDFHVTEPLVLGHESGGTIVAVGADVDESRIGQRVSIEPQRPGTTSHEVLTGHYNLDPDMKFYAVPGTDGAFAEYVLIQSHFAWAIPESVSDDAAALMEPLSVAIAAVRKAQITVGSRVLITGSGPIGVALTQVARAYGASEIIVTDLDEQRRDQATRFGATRVLDPATERIGSLGLEVDAFIDASGAPAAVTSGLREIRRAGICVCVGVGALEISMPMPTIQDREIWVTGIFRYTDTWPTAIELVRSGKVDLDGMVTGHFRLDEVEAAMRATKDPSTLKSVVNPGS